jgi:hypothetical protein
MIYKSENKLLDTFGASIKCYLCGEKIKDGESVINLTKGYRLPARREKVNGTLVGLSSTRIKELEIQDSSNKSPKVICEECFYGRCY